MSAWAGRGAALLIVATSSAVGLSIAIARTLARWPREWATTPGVNTVLDPMATGAIVGVVAVLAAAAAARHRGLPIAKGLLLTARLVAPLSLSLLLGVGLVFPIRGLTRATLLTVILASAANAFRVVRGRRRSPAETIWRSPAAIALGIIAAELALLPAVLGYRPTHRVASSRDGTVRLDTLRSTFRGEGQAWAPSRVLPARSRLALENLPDADAYLAMRVGLPPEASGSIVLHVGNPARKPAAACTIVTHDPLGQICMARIPDSRSNPQLWFDGDAPFVYLLDLDVGPPPAVESRWLRGSGDPGQRLAPEPPHPDPWRKVAAAGDSRNAILLDVPARRCFPVAPVADPRTLDATLLEGLPTGDVAIHAELHYRDLVIARAEVALDRRGWVNLGLDPGATTADELCVDVRGVEARGWSVAIAEPLARIADEPRTPRPNILLVSIDTLRADAMSAYGGPAATPAFDGLAARGALFLAAVAPSSWTLPSHASMFTGLLPSRHRLWGSRDSAMSRRIPDDIPTLAQALRDHGYTTQATTGGAFVSALPGLARGFDRFNEAVTWSGGKDLPSVEARAVLQLEMAREPFFQFVHTYSVHSPYGSSPAPDPGTYRDDAVAAKAHYLAGVTYTDSLLEALFATLDRRGLRERTVIVVTSDHGEEFADHHPGTFIDGHGQSVFEELLHVPLAIAGPFILPGSRVHEPISLCDLAPTLLQLAGAPPLPASDGLSLVETLREGFGVAARVILAESASEPPQRKAARLGMAKLILTLPDDFQLFDLHGDPGERMPLADPAQVARLRPALEGLAAEPPPLEASAGANPDPRNLEQLRALGYLQ